MGLTSAEKMRAMRERARAKGQCPVCCKRKPWKTLTVCRKCNNAAKERVKASRI